MAASSQGPRPQLGAGWPFPVRPRDGRLALVRGEQSVDEAIGIILETAARERVMLPAFGAGLRTYVFQTNGALTRAAVAAEVRRALVRWEPRIRVERVEARTSPDEPNLLLVEIDYAVKRTSSFYNRVHPYYLAQPEP